jgi:mannose-6-phosphate isomerase-like protein (cupin superfamily)
MPDAESGRERSARRLSRSSFSGELPRREPPPTVRRGRFLPYDCTRSDYRKDGVVADVIVKHIDELESGGGNGRFLFARKGLGVTSFGMNVERFPAGFADYPEHDHEKDGQEEVYFVFGGGVTLHAGDEAFELTPGMFARVGPSQKRKLVPGDDGVEMLVIGGVPGTFEAQA